MKLTNILFPLMAVAIQAQPIEERSTEVAVLPMLADSPFALDTRDIEARDANMRITVWPDTSCGANGGGRVISRRDAVAKGNFSPAQRSVRLDALNDGYHVSFYPGSNQSPSGKPNLRLNSGNVGNCWYFGSGWLSWGLYTGS